MEVIGEFSNFVVYQEEEEIIYEHPTTWEERIVGQNVLQLKGNSIP